MNDYKSYKKRLCVIRVVLKMQNRYYDWMYLMLFQSHKNVFYESEIFIYICTLYMHMCITV